LVEQKDCHKPIREKSNQFGPLEIPQVDNFTPPNSENDDGDTILCVCGATEVVPGDGKELIECGECKIWQHTDCIDYLCHQCSERAQQIAAEHITRHVRTDSSTEQDAPSNLRLRSAIIRIEELQEILVGKEKKLQESQHTVDELNRDIWQLKTAKEQRERHSGTSIEEEMVRQQKQVQILRNELQARRRLGTFTMLPPTPRNQAATTEINNGFNDAYSSSHQIFAHLDIELFPVIPQLDHHLDLLRLAQRVFVSGADGTLLSQDIDLSEFDPAALLRALTTAALQNWVFESDFPKFDNESSTILAAYRNILASQGNITIVTLKI